MVHPVHGTDPDKEEHRTYKTLEPEGEIAVVQRPEGTVKILFYTCSGADKNLSYRGRSWTTKQAFDLAMEILQQAYRDSSAEKDKFNLQLLGGRGRARLTGPHSTSRTRSMNSGDSP